MKPLIFTKDRREYQIFVSPEDSRVERGTRVYVFGIAHHFFHGRLYISDARSTIAHFDAIRHVLEHGEVLIWLDGRDRRPSEVDVERGRPWCHIQACSIPMYGPSILRVVEIVDSTGDARAVEYLDLTLPSGAELAARVMVGWRFSDLPGSPWNPARDVAWLPRVRVVVPMPNGQPPRAAVMPEDFDATSASPPAPSSPA